LELHLLQKQVAERIAVNVETLKNWERGVGSPTIRQIPAIIEFLAYNPEPDPKAMPKRIAHVRRQLGLTQKGLAKALAVDSVTIYRWEKGLVEPPEMKLQHLSRLMRASNKSIPR